jgi:acetyl esterase
MPLDPRAQEYLDRLAALGAPPLNRMTPEEARADMRARTADLGEPEPVAAVENVMAAGPAGEIPVRLYTPSGRGPFPVVVYFHGGGWVIGDIDTHDALCRSLANAAGCQVANVGYRLAPEHKYPAAAEDSYAATRWIAENAAALGADGARIAVAGDSAGGNLAAAVALMARDRGGPRLAFQLLVYPITDHSYDTPSYRENAEGYLLTRDIMVWFWDCYLASPEEGRQPYASPLQAPSLSGLPPAMVITAEYDPLRDEGEAYARRLDEAGVPVTLKRYGSIFHGFILLTRDLDQAREAVDEAGRALREALQWAP